MKVNSSSLSKLKVQGTRVLKEVSRGTPVIKATPEDRVSLSSQNRARSISLEKKSSKRTKSKTSATNRAIYNSIDFIHNSYKSRVESMISRIRFLNMEIMNLEIQLNTISDPTEREMIRQRIDRLKLERDNLRLRARMEAEQWVRDIRGYIRDLESEIMRKRAKLNSTTDPKEKEKLQKEINELEQARDHAVMLLNEAERETYSIP